MNFTFLHCADLHLGSPMRGLALKDADVAARFAAASREAFHDLVSRAIAARVAFVLIAGDVYDGEWRDNSVGLFFNREIGRLAKEQIPVFFIKGNHDAESVVTRTLPLPKDFAFEFSTRAPQTHELPQWRVAIHGQSFPDRAVNENIALRYPAPKSGWFNIGLLHTSCEGNTKHATYAPCSIDDLVARGYDYWALGHIHQYQELRRDPWIVYPGNLQGRHVGEAGEKGAVFVDVADGRIAGVRREIVDRARWLEATVDVSAAAHAADAIEAAAAHLRPALNEAAERLVAARVRLAGVTSLDRRLRADHAQLADELTARLRHLHADVWLEKLSIETTEPAAARPRAALAGIDLAAMLDEAAQDAGARAAIEAALGDIAARLRADSGDSDAPLSSDIEALIAEARALVLSRALGEEAGA